MATTNRCKRCGASDARTTIYKETGLCMNCQTDWRLEQKEKQSIAEAKRAKKEKDFYKF